MFWVSTISSKRDLNLKYSQGLPENLTTSKGERLDLVTIESILVVSFAIIVSVASVGNNTLPGWQTPLHGKAPLIKGVASGFRLHSLTLGSDIAAPPEVELNNGTIAGSDFSASDSCNSVFSSLILG